MSEEIKIDFTDAYINLDNLKKDIEDFAPYTEEYLQDLGKECKSFNSDFNLELMALFDKMKDDSGPKMLEKIETFEASVRNAIKSIENGDEEIGVKLRKNKGRTGKGRR